MATGPPVSGELVQHLAYAPRSAFPIPHLPQTRSPRRDQLDWLPTRICLLAVVSESVPCLESLDG